jgi:hypothetical protein
MGLRVHRSVGLALFAGAAAYSPLPQGCPTITGQVACEVPTGATYGPLPPPLFKQTFQMNLSTIVMPCNSQRGDAGWSNASFFGSFGVADYDWSNAKAYWSKAKPMDCQERLVTQAQMTKHVHPEGKVWVYRNLVKALPWFSDVRKKINDPAYSGWFLHNHGATSLFHDSEQTAAGDCGGVICGEYLWDHRNQSVRAFLVDTVVGGPDALGNPAIDGLFLDDFWSNFPYHLPWSGSASRDCSMSKIGGPSEIKGGCTGAMGLSAVDVENIAQEWFKTTQAVFAKIVAMKGYAWQMLQFPDDTTGSLSAPRTAAFFRRECRGNSTSATSPIMMRFSEVSKTDPATGGPELPSFEQDLAAFLLVRSEFAWLGYSWGGCNRKYTRPAMLDADFGTPVDTLCSETTTGSGVFKREWSGASVQLDTNTNKATIMLKQ